MLYFQFTVAKVDSHADHRQSPRQTALLIVGLASNTGNSLPINWEATDGSFAAKVRGAGAISEQTL